MSEIAELLPCPFCKSTNVEADDNGRGLIFFVRCRVCRSAGPGEQCAADAITAWNTRAATRQPDAQAMQALLERCRDREYNPFEPDNQTALYHDICRALAKEPK